MCDLVYPQLVRVWLVLIDPQACVSLNASDTPPCLIKKVLEVEVDAFIEVLLTPIEPLFLVGWSQHLPLAYALVDSATGLIARSIDFGWSGFPVRGFFSL